MSRILPSVLGLLLLGAGCGSPEGPTEPEDLATRVAPHTPTPAPSGGPSPPERTGRPLRVSVDPPIPDGLPTDDGRAAWTLALGYEGELDERRRAHVEFAAAMYGDAPGKLGPVAIQRLRSQAASGTFDRILAGEPVTVEVYADEMRYVAEKLGWTDPDQRRTRHAELQDLTARLLLEFGELGSVDARTWFAIERSLRPRPPGESGAGPR